MPSFLLCIYQKITWFFDIAVANVKFYTTHSVFAKEETRRRQASNSGASECIGHQRVKGQGFKFTIKINLSYGCSLAGFAVSNNAEKLLSNFFDFDCFAADTQTIISSRPSINVENHPAGEPTIFVNRLFRSGINIFCRLFAS